MTVQELTRRQQAIWGLFDFAHGHGLEIGPLHNCCVPRGAADVSYLDVFDRDHLIADWAHDPNVPPEAIPDIDFVLSDEDGTVRSIPEAIGAQPLFDWVMASHVVEHVPDFIGWLNQIAEITVDGGALVLAVPDRRYCFDLHRPGTSLGQMLQAHEAGDVVPSVRAVYDYRRGHASVRAPDVWAGRPVGYENRIFTLDAVQDCVARARAGEYVDSHVWLFTPGTFLEQVVELRNLGLAAWRVESLRPTQRNQLEFYAVLRRLPRAGNWSRELFADEPTAGTMPDWVAEGAQLTTEVVQLRERIAKVIGERDRARRTRSALEDKLARLEAQRRQRPAYRAKALLRRQPWMRPALELRRRLRARR